MQAILIVPWEPPVDNYMFEYNKVSQPRATADLPSSKNMNYIWTLSNRHNSQPSASRMKLVYAISYCVTDSGHS